VISTAGDWLFVHVPKTAGNSIQALLVARSDDRLVASRHQDGRDRFGVEGPVTPRKHTSLDEYRRLLPAATFERLLKFAVVRNPWERAVSAYFGPIHWLSSGGVPAWSPEAFLGGLATLPSITSMTSLDGRVALDVTLRFERLQRDVDRLFDRLVLPRVALPHRNRGLAALPWRAYYERDPELVTAVGELFADDAANFGYTYAP
jgi:Sulfotransferase family